MSAAAAQAPAIAEPSSVALRDNLFRQTLKHPQDVSLAFAYADACVSLKDYEGAIGALERVLMFSPDDPHLQAQLGFLYAQLHSYQMSKQYFDSALASSKLDDATRSKIAALGPTMETANTGNHTFAFFQSGVRYQSNAAFNSDSNLVRYAGLDETLRNPHDRGSDVNGFQTLQLGFDQDLGNQRGDTLEFRLTGYASQQARFTDLNVGLYDMSLGPRMKLAPDLLPDWTIKPYAVGGQAFLAGQTYFSSGGAGVIADIPVRPGYVLEPGVEFRGVHFDNVSVFSSLNSGNEITLSMSGSAEFNARLSAVTHFFWTRNSASAADQSSDSFGEEFALVAKFASPIPHSAMTWSVSPYVKLLQTRFDGPNGYIDGSVTRHDRESDVGLVLDTPLSARITVVTNVQFGRINSNISNFRVSNVSFLTGPAVRF